MTSVVEQRVRELRQKIKDLTPTRDASHDDICRLVKRRQKAITTYSLIASERKPSNAYRSVRIRQKMSKKFYEKVKKRVKAKHEEEYYKKRSGLMLDVNDTTKALVMVSRFHGHLSEKIQTLIKELTDAYNSDAWNLLVKDKRQRSDGMGRGSRTKPAGKAKPKAVAGGRGRPAGGERLTPSPATPPMPADDGLPNFAGLQVAAFKGPWLVSCDQLTAEATVGGDGLFDMHQKYHQGSGMVGGWSALRCKIVRDSSIKSFVTNIDGAVWIMTKADMDMGGKSVIRWSAENKPDSVWTRQKRQKEEVPARKSAVGKATPKQQVRRTVTQPTTPITDMQSDITSSGIGESQVPPAGGATGGSPTPQPVEWYTEIRDGKLMWTDGISAVPAEDRVTDDSRQKNQDAVLG